MTTFNNARDELFKVFLDAWNNGASALVGYVPEIRWQGVVYADEPDGSLFWARASKQTVLEEQATLSTCEQAPGQKKYTTTGNLFIQIFCPRSDVTAYEKGGKLAELTRNAYRGVTTESKIWFRNARINELNPERLFERFNVVVEFEYDQIF